jgi:hypothetical protein
LVSTDLESDHGIPVEPALPAAGDFSRAIAWTLATGGFSAFFVGNLEVPDMDACTAMKLVSTQYLC